MCISFNLYDDCRVPFSQAYRIIWWLPSVLSTGLYNYMMIAECPFHRPLELYDDCRVSFSQAFRIIYFNVSNMLKKKLNVQRAKNIPPKSTNLLAICMQVAFICTGNINKLYSQNDNQGKKHKTDFTQFTNSTPHVNI